MPAEAGPWDGAAAGPACCLTPSFSNVILHEGMGVKHQALLRNTVLTTDNLYFANCEPVDNAVLSESAC